MTPADRLTRAADTLDALADAATPGPWGVEDRAVYGPRFARACSTEFASADNAPLIALTSDPATVRLIAAWLRDEAEARAGVWMVTPDATPALALADHINERSTP